MDIPLDLPSYRHIVFGQIYFKFFEILKPWYFLPLQNKLSFWLFILFWPKKELTCTCTIHMVPKVSLARKLFSTSVTSASNCQISFFWAFVILLLNFPLFQIFWNFETFWPLQNELPFELFILFWPLDLPSYRHIVFWPLCERSKKYVYCLGGQEVKKRGQNHKP